jgi:membrane fusion protein (multidrug efflux system)
MKNLLSLTLLTFLLISCGDNKEQSIEDIIATDNLEAIRQKRATIVTQQQEINNKIKQLDDKISELDKSKKIPLITTFTVQQEVFNHYLELQGNVQTKQNLVIYPEIPGILQRVYVKEGQRVSKGQLLASIDDGGMEQQVAQLQIQADLAKTTFERQERLWDKKIGSEIQYLQAKSSYEAQQKAVSQLKSQLEKSSVRAPFSGVIDDVISEQGSVVSPGQSQLMRIVNLRDMYIETDVPESYISSVSKNKDVLVEFPVLGKTMNAKIRQTGNFINPANRTFKIEIAVPNKDRAIKPNLTAKLKINDYTNENAILIPQDIISENANGEQYIYVVKDKNGKYAIADQVIIETGKTQGDVIEVLKGLEKNDVEIIQEGARSVRNQQEVEISNK